MLAGIGVFGAAYLAGMVVMTVRGLHEEFTEHLNK